MPSIVLTADKTLMSDYGGNEFLGFAACGPAVIPEILYEYIFCRPVPVAEDGVSAKFAPYGLRLIESVLVERGYDVVVTRPDKLREAADSSTEVIGISTNDPLGLGPASSTFGDFAAKETFSAKSFRALMFDPVVRRRDIKVIVGGPGAWQLEDERIAAKYGIDCVIIGEGELVAPRVFEMALKGEKLPRFVHGDVTPLEKIPRINHAAVNGLIEIARGCGRGCRFCNPTMRKYRCKPLPHILEEARISYREAGYVLLHAEDVLRYNAKEIEPDVAEVVRLFESVKSVIEMEKENKSKRTLFSALRRNSHEQTVPIGISHFAFSSVVARPEVVSEISRILEVGTHNRHWISGQVGIETGSARLVSMHMRGKVRPFKPEQWCDVVIEAHQILKENRWVPCSTLIVGMPGEKPSDVVQTIELIDNLKSYKSFIVPLLFVPIGVLNRDKFFSSRDFMPEHWMLIAACIKHDFKWIYTIVDEYFSMSKTGKIRVEIMKLLVKYAERKLKPLVADMECGRDPSLRHSQK
ncbi:MAG: B12-binding domain-containing radical SAM protein [Canidatus Methanoxibalbensis ujae]|nr:B12-binding domain-containing radical SAM protein [Candidatus Methanoxibalbensis ujae]MCW7079327.1 B12-binding domain-containing radical SAM protein [Candidatus Methanoxibalbensis ujae]